MIDRSKLTQPGLELKDPASPSQIVSLERNLGIPLPRSYQELLLASDGLERFDGGLVLYPAREIPERNATYEIPRRLPGWLLIGFDSGDEGYFLDTMSPEAPVYIVGFGALAPDEAYRLADSLEAWVAASLPEDLPEPQIAGGYAHRPVDISVIAFPPWGNQQLLALKKHMALSQSIAQLVAAARNPPAVLKSGVPLSSALATARQFNSQRPWLAVSEVGDPSAVIPEAALDSAS